MLAEDGNFSGLTRRLFGSMLRRIAGFAAARRVGAAARQNQSGRRRGVEGGVSVKSLRNGANDGFLVPAKALPGTPGALGLKRIQKRSRAEANGGILVRSRKAKRKFRLILFGFYLYVNYRLTHVECRDNFASFRVSYCPTVRRLIATRYVVVPLLDDLHKGDPHGQESIC